MTVITTLDTPEQIRAIADPRRLAILRYLMRAPSTLTQLGVAFEHHPAWIRHHVLQLQAAGLVDLAETRHEAGHVEKYYRASGEVFRLDMFVTPGSGSAPSVLIAGSDDPAIHLLVEGDLPDLPAVVTLSLGSLEGLLALRRGLCHAAGCHLLDADTGEFNVPYVRRLFPGSSITLMTLYHREQGLMVAPGNPLQIESVADLAARRARIVNRNRGSGTRVWFDHVLAESGADASRLAGYGDEVTTHAEAAAAVAEGRADAALGLRAAATAAGLGFVPLLRERYDLAMYSDQADGPLLGPLRERLTSPDARRLVDELGGYDTADCGHTITINA
jgi:putative molybdopterin biosynthesis protein